MKLFSSVLTLLLLAYYANSNVYSKETPPFKYFGAQDYSAGTQNWSITNSNTGEIFVANNEGVLLYDGVNWRNLGAFNNTIVRSIHFKNTRLYVGMYMEFGFYEEDEFGDWNYTSLIKNTDGVLKEDEQFWDILELGDQLIFQSLDQLIIYDLRSEKTSVIEHSTGIIGAWVANQTLYVQDTHRNLYKIRGNEWKLELESKDIDSSKILTISLIDNQLTLLTEKGIFLRYFNNDLWGVIQGTDVITSPVYSAIFKDDKWFVGTISDGLVVLDRFGKTLYKIGSNNGLRNNTVLAIHGDNNDNIWLGLDNGVIYINDKSNISTYSDSLNEIGTIYTSAYFKDTLYIGTNVGIFYKSQQMEKFSKILNLNEQVWSLFQGNGKLLVGHHKGISEIEGLAVSPIHEGQGAWIFRPISGTNKLLIGTYKGFEIIEMELDKWRWKGKVEGFDLSSRFLEAVDSTTFLVSHEYKGIYKVELSRNFERVANFKLYQTPSKGTYSSLASFNGYIWYHDSSGLWKYNSEIDQFEPQGWSNQVFKNEEYITGKMVNLEDNSLWFFKKERLIRFLPSILENEYDLQTFPILTEYIRPNRGFENISKVEEDYLIGGVNQYLKINFPHNKHPRAPIIIQKVLGTNNRTLDYRKFSLQGKEKLPNNFNNISFTLGFPYYEVFGSSKLFYRLYGYQENFIQWDKKSDIVFGNLKPGNYRLQLKIDEVEEVYSNDIYEFQILYPWYQHPLMYLAYLIISLSVIWIIHRSYLRYFKAKELRIHEENERMNELKRLQIKENFMHEKNTFLEQQYKKNKKELANTLLKLSKNTEVLNKLKNQSRKTNTDPSLINLIEEVDLNLSSSSSWNFLEKAFENIDDKFLTNIKELHPDLNSNDLKFIIHLRLNLNNKEISTLYNISIKGVEIKRYRLRKKLGLTREISLQDYIQRI